MQLFSLLMCLAKSPVFSPPPLSRDVPLPRRLALKPSSNLPLAAPPAQWFCVPFWICCAKRTIRSPGQKLTFLCFPPGDYILFAYALPLMLLYASFPLIMSMPDAVPCFFSSPSHDTPPFSVVV